MTDNEIKLINLIRDYKHPDKALVIAIGIILGFLMQPQSSAKQLVDDFRKLA